MQAQRTLKSEMQATASAFDKNASASDKARAKTKQLTQAVQNQERRIEQLQKMTKASADATGENSTATLKWKQALADAETELSRLNDELAENNQLKALGEDMQNAGQKISSVGDTMTKAVTVPLAAVGAASVKAAVDFESAMAKVGTIADTTQVPMSDLEKSIMNLSDQTGVSASEIAENVYSAISAGQDTASAVGFVESAIQLARAGFTDTSSAIDVMTTAMNAYGMSAEEVTALSDKMITTQNRGKTTVAELASSMGKVIPTAAAFGVNLDNLSSAYVTLTKNGISTAEGTTYLNSMINELGKSGTKASNVLKERTGKTFAELMNDGNDLSDVLRILQEHADESGLSMADMFGSAEAGKAALSLMSDGGAEFVASMEAMQNSAGATQAAYDTMSDTTAVRFQKALNQIKNTGIRLGTTLLTTLADPIDTVAAAIEGACEWFGNLDDDTKEFIVKAGLVTAAVGPVLSVFGRLTTSVGKVVSGIGTLSTKVGGLGGAFSGAGILGAAGVVGGLAIAIEASREAAVKATPGHKDFIDSVDQIKAHAENAQTSIDNINATLAGGLEGAETTAANLSYWQEQLEGCFEANGQLKEGMASTAEYAAGQLNAAMGTDFSTSFTEDFGANKATLDEFNGAVDNYVLKLKEAAVQQAFSSSYGEAITAQAEAMQSVTDAQNAQAEAANTLATAWANYNAAAQADSSNLSEYNANLQAARSEVVAASKDYQAAAGALNDTSAAAASASTTVTLLEQAMQMMASATTPEEQQAAIDLFASIGTAAQTAGEQAAAGAQSATTAATEMATAMQNAASEGSLSGVTGDIDITLKPNVDSSGIDKAVKDAVSSAKATAEGEEIKPQIGEAEGAEESAETAHSVMDKIIKAPINGRVGSVSNAGAAVHSALSTMQAYLNANPLTAKVNVQQTVVSVTQSAGKISVATKHADGGIVGTEQLSWLAENNKPEAVIPLSLGKRARAMSLYGEVGRILGANAGYVGGSSTTNNNTNNSVAISVYGAPGQNMEELADIIQDKINNQLYRKGAAWA